MSSAFVSAEMQTSRLELVRPSRTMNDFRKEVHMEWQIFEGSWTF